MEIYQQIYRSAKILLLIVASSISYAATLEADGFDDWIISFSCSKSANILCDGYYKQPAYEHSITNTSTKQPITITSDEASFVSKGTSVFSGNVVATQGNKILYTDKADVVHNEKSGDLETITALGHVKIMQPGLRVDGTTATAYIAKDQKVIKNAVYRIYDRHARGKSDELIISGQNRMCLTPASYTTCAPNSNAWYLKASETNFDRETGRGEAWNARMYLKDVPVFYWPYVNFPIDDRRQTGFLQPEYKSSTNDGRTFLFPFYWNIAPNYDSTITPQYMSKRGLKVDTLSRYLTSSSNGTFRFDFLPHDNAYQALRNQAYADSGFMLSSNPADALRRNDLKPRDFRYRYALKHTTNFTPNFKLFIDYSDASDGNYFSDFVNDTYNYADNQASIMYAAQRGSLQYTDQWGTLAYKLEQYKSFHVVNGPSGPQQLSRLPEVIYNSATFNLPQDFSCLMNASFTRFIPRLVTDNNVSLNYGQRLYLRPALIYRVLEPGWFLQSRLQFNYAQYSDLHLTPSQLAAGANDHRPDLALPIFDVKTGLIFDRPFNFRGTELFQTFEPVLYYLYVPIVNQNNLPNFDSGILNFDYNQLFRDNRYAGYDRVSAANQISLGLATRLFKSNDGEERAMFGIGQTRYFTPNTVPLVETNQIDKHWSPLAMIGKFKITPVHNLEANWVKNRQTTLFASVQLQYRPEPTKVINFGYEFLHSTEPDDLTGQYSSDLKQINLSGAWKMSPQMRLLGKATYDLRFHRQLYMLAGFEYHTCCTALRFVWNKVWQANVSTMRDYVYGFGIQFVFKGFAGIGTADDRAIAALIPGYDSNITRW